MTMVFNLKINTKPLEQLEKQVIEKAKKAVKKHALIIQANAAKNAPVDTGALKNSISALPVEDGKNWSVQDGVEYGIYQELGSPPRAKKPHFLGNACEKQADKFFDELKEVLR
jgi:HK97 gp10 family phage protein